MLISYQHPCWLSTYSWWSDCETSPSSRISFLLTKLRMFLVEKWALYEFRLAVLQYSPSFFSSLTRTMEKRILGRLPHSRSKFIGVSLGRKPLGWRITIARQLPPSMAPPEKLDTSPSLGTIWPHHPSESLSRWLTINLTSSRRWSGPIIHVELSRRTHFLAFYVHFPPPHPSKSLEKP